MNEDTIEPSENFDEFRTILRDVISEIACIGAEPARLAAE